MADTFSGEPLLPSTDSSLVVTSQSDSTSMGDNFSGKQPLPPINSSLYGLFVVKFQSGSLLSVEEIT